MNQSLLSETQEEILESVWKAGETGEHRLIGIRSFCAVSFEDHDLQGLVDLNLVKVNDEILMLSDEGRKRAEQIIRRHRIAEVLVVSILKHKSAEMERIACEVEHSLQPEVEEAICTLLGHPEFCPDGKPIPRGACCRKRVREVGQTVVSLEKLHPGDSGKVTYIKPSSHSILEQLISFGLSPGVIVTLTQVKPVFCVKFENTELALDREIVKNIFVWKID
ncbi:MAG: metal-dependent transcriptional regulator [Proteobacteria bacterium]|nr:metal-dependent transcriptional regulator [Pseudomonadota bacterium]